MQQRRSSLLLLTVLCLCLTQVQAQSQKEIDFKKACDYVLLSISKNQASGLPINHLTI